MYTLKINLIDVEGPVSIPIESFSIMNSEQDISLGGAAIGGLYCILTGPEIDKYFYLVQKNVTDITIYEQIPTGEPIIPEDSSTELVSYTENPAYTSVYWNRIVSLSGTYDAGLHKMIMTLHIGHMIKEGE